MIKINFHGGKNEFFLRCDWARGGWSRPMMIPYLPSCVAVPLWVSVHRAVCQFLHPVFPGLERKHHHTPFMIMCVWITTTKLTCLLMNICVQTIAKAIWVSDLSHSPSLSIVLQAAASIFRKVFPKHTHNWDSVREEASALQHSLCHQQVPYPPKSQLWTQVKLQPALSSGLTVDYADFQGLTIYHWLQTHFALWPDNIRNNSTPFIVHGVKLHGSSCDYCAYCIHAPPVFTLG